MGSSEPVTLSLPNHLVTVSCTDDDSVTLPSLEDDVESVRVSVVVIGSLVLLSVMDFDRALAGSRNSASTANIAHSTFRCVISKETCSYNSKNAPSSNERGRME